MKKEVILSLLEGLQKKEGYISEESLKKLAIKHDIPLVKLYGVATFYHMLHVEKQGKKVISICNSPSCYVNGSLNLIKEIEKILNIKSGETSKDRKYSLHICSCIGCCDKAPAMMINGKVYGNLTKEKVRKLIK